MIHPITLIVSGLVSASVLAAPPTHAEPPAAPEAPLGTMLDETPPPPPHRAGRGGPGMEHGPGQHDMPRGRRFGMLHRAFTALSDADVPEEIRLTPGQTEALKVLRDEMRAKFEAGERPLSKERPFAMAKQLLTPEQVEFIESCVQEHAAEAIESRRGMRGRGMGPHAQFTPEQRETMKMFRELSPEAKQRVNDLIKQEYELQQES